MALRPNAGHASSFLRFLDHTQRRITVGRTPLDERSACLTDLYLTTHNTHKIQTSMPAVGIFFFETFTALSIIYRFCLVFWYCVSHTMSSSTHTCTASLQRCEGFPSPHRSPFWQRFAHSLGSRLESGHTRVSIDSFLPSASGWPPGMTSISRGARRQYSRAVISTHSPSKRAAVDPRIRPRSHRVWLWTLLVNQILSCFNFE